MTLTLYTSLPVEDLIACLQSNTDPSRLKRSLGIGISSKPFTGKINSDSFCVFPSFSNTFGRTIPVVDGTVRSDGVETEINLQVRLPVIGYLFGIIFFFVTIDTVLRTGVWAGSLVFLIGYFLTLITFNNALSEIQDQFETILDKAEGQRIK